ncbi:Fic family protein [Candidatus Woesearchaeota archaeon]|nr:Fic family protein [Candidatus Woesearchaeota archaeon]
MVNIVTKRIGRNEYLYLVRSLRDGEKVVQKTLKYIGKKRPIPEEEFECMKLSAEDKDWILSKQEDVLSYTEHEKLKLVSQSYHQHMKTLNTISKEQTRENFLSKFIASSNAIEGSTMTQKETYEYLFNDTIPNHRKKKELFMATNLYNAWIFLEKNFHRHPTHHDMHELHKRVNKDIETEETLGRYKKVQNYIGDVYTTSYIYVQDRMHKLLRWIRTAYKNINDFEVAFQSHAQFEIIHPFVDGNGRVGRLLINWILLNKKYAPIAIRAERRNEYIQAIDTARKGSREAIVKFCAEEYLEQYKFREESV